MPVIFQKKWKN